MRDAAEGQQKHGQQKHIETMPLFSTMDRNGRMTMLRSVRSTARSGADTRDQHFPRSSGHGEHCRGAAACRDRCNRWSVLASGRAVRTDQGRRPFRDTCDRRRAGYRGGSPPALDADKQSGAALRHRSHSDVADDPARARRHRRSWLRPYGGYHARTVTRLNRPRRATSGGHPAPPLGGFVIRRDIDCRELH